MIIKFLFLLFPIFLFSTSSCVFTTDYKNVKPKTETYTQSIDEDLSFEMISVITEDLITLGEDVESVTKKVYINSFSLAKYELSYNIYYKIRVWAEENGYKFENKGSEGAYSKVSGNDTNALFFANEGGKPLTEGLPVNGISWRDAIVWCNALNEYLKLEPVYCSDADFNNPIKCAIHETGKAITGCPLEYSELAKDIDMISLQKGNIDNPYINKNSSGYRLPYDFEWEYAARKCSDGSFISGANAPGDKEGPSKARSDEPTLIEQIKGITKDQIKPYSRGINAYGWGFNKRKSRKTSDIDENGYRKYCASDENGPSLTAAGYDDSVAPSSMQGFKYRIHKQGGKLPVDLGFYDMAGNSYEWTFDFSSSYDWKYDIYSNRTYRGGTFQWDVSYFEAGYRPLIPPYVKSGGIRLARNY